MEMVIGSVAALFLMMAVWSMALPERFLNVFGSQVLGRDGRCEVRAVYGGFGFAVAALLVFAILSESHRTGIVLTVSVALAGMAFGRLVSGSLDRGLSPLMAGTTIGEVLAALVLYLSTHP